ncbi:hypothetical protein C1I95_24690 [Micromonospora craterilacus]|uniref:Uncharacterized protein n=1 Tax=Micromonospora craterilacus TaxID=1655439 RepID=A0A2W2E6V0_9ACTN|nr:hypothetical protein [Micromonospora craterilacus]PZG12945.1 hypothetical protein C1I95_24690 [Micromonospora craterilacus]
MTPTAETLWRCTACGKWSHAKRRPKQHKRYVVTGTKTVPYQEAETGAWVDEEVPDGDFQPCGPFVRWEARRMESPPRVVTVVVPGVSS